MKKQNNVGADDPTMYAEFVRRNVGAGDSARHQKRNTQKGITLIALIISIIVMLILAAVSINIIINQGIMTKSKDAADTHQIAAEKEAIQIGYSEYLTKKYNGETATLTVADANVQENANEWTITFNAEPKNVYKLSKNGGEPEGPLTGDNAGETTESLYVTPRTEVTYKGQTLKVGDYVNYDEGTGYTWTTDASKGTGEDDNLTSKTYTTEDMNWRVLGLDANGNLELISDKPTSEYLDLKGKSGYLNGENQLNEMCNELYGQGEKAVGARSVTDDDVNAILGYNKREFKMDHESEIDEETGEYYPEIHWKYGFKVTNYKNKTTWEPEDTFIMKDGSNEYIREGDYETFINIDGTVATDEVPITIECTEYFYTRNEFKDKIDADILEMILGPDIQASSSDSDMWLASSGIRSLYYNATWGIPYIRVGDKIFNSLYMSNGTEDCASSHVRPVVTLKSDVQLSGNSTDGWTIQ